MLTVRDTMTRRVISVTPETPLKDVARLLVESGVSGLPVVDADGAVLGVVSETDLVIKEQGAGAIHHRPLAWLLGESPEATHQLAKIAARTAGEAMSRPAITIAPDQPVGEAAAALVAHDVNRLPVVEDGRLVGIVTRTDLVRAYLRTDADLAHAIEEEVLRRVMWLDPGEFEVSVVNGVARIRGAVDRRSTATAIGRFAATVPGIVGVLPELTWELNDEVIQPESPDYVSPFTAPRGH